jgi:hypothetical protein
MAKPRSRRTYMAGQQEEEDGLFRVRVRDAVIRANIDSRRDWSEPIPI